MNNWAPLLGDAARWTCKLRHWMFFIVHSTCNVYNRCIHTSCVQVVVVSSCTSKRWFIIYQRTTNTILLVARVLNYAIKHKYPTNRSAFTYWLNDYPPRIDNGKSKYGGPFTEEQVENVKHSFIYYQFCSAYRWYSYQQHHLVVCINSSCNITYQNLDDCLLGSTYFVSFCIALNSQLEWH